MTAKSARLQYFQYYRKQLGGDTTSFTAAVQKERGIEMAKKTKPAKKPTKTTKKTK